MRAIFWQKTVHVVQGTLAAVAWLEERPDDTSNIAVLMSQSEQRKIYIL